MATDVVTSSKKNIQLKAAAINFAVLMIIITVIQMLEAYDIFTDYPVSAIFYAGFLLHLFVLPHIAKKANEK